MNNSKGGARSRTSGAAGRVHWPAVVTLVLAALPFLSGAAWTSYRSLWFQYAAARAVGTVAEIAPDGALKVEYLTASEEFLTAVTGGSPLVPRLSSPSVVSQFRRTSSSEERLRMSVINPWYQLGYIIPHIYTDMDAYQFYRVAPEGMMLVTTGFNLAGHSLEAFENELPTFWRCVDTLATKKVDRIALSGVPVASVLGRKRMLEILAEAERRTGIPCDTDFEAHIAALKHFGATRIALATRWPESTNTLVKSYLAAAGIEVLATRSRAMSFEVSKSFRAAEDHLLALELGGQVLRETPQAQALLMPGGLWHAMHAVPILEAEHGRPVLLNILSTTRAALAAAGDRIKVRPDPRWGKVLASA